MKIVCVVSGGVLQGVFTDAKGPVEVELVDHDNLAAEGKSREERELAESRVINGLRAVF